MGASGSGEEHNVQIVALDRLALDDVVQLRDERYAYCLKVTSADGQTIADAWRLDLKNPMHPDGSPNWKGLEEPAVLCGSCDGALRWKGRTADDQEATHLIPINAVLGRYAVGKCAWMRMVRNAGEPGTYRSYQTGQIVSLTLQRALSGNRS